MLLQLVSKRPPFKGCSQSKKEKERRKEKEKQNKSLHTEREPTWENKALSGSDSILPASCVIGAVNPIGSPNKQGPINIGVTGKKTNKT